MINMPAILDRWAAAWSSRNVEKVLGLFTDDCIFEDAPTGTVNAGKDALREFAEFFFAAAPDFKLELSSRVEGARWAAGEWKISGTHWAAVPNPRMKGKRFSIRGATFLELEGDKIRRCRARWELPAFLRQTR